MEFGAALRNLRREKRLSLKRLAPDLGISYTYLSKLENGLVRPSDELVGRMASYFGYDEGELMLTAGHIPAEIMRALQDDPAEAIAFLRERFGTAGASRSQTTTAADDHRSAG